MTKISGTEGYAETAQDYLARDGDLVFDEVHAPILRFLPTAPSDVLDIGAGSGRDAAHLAALGHRLVAVEPTDELRAHAVSTYASPRIEWLNDGLPNLGATRALNRSYDFVMLSAVWMHLDEAERARAMPNLASLMRKDARAAISLRHGPVPPGRRMFEVTAEETMALAQASGLACLLNQRHPSIQEHNRRAGVVWTRLAFRRE